jgi:bacterioferritin
LTGSRQLAANKWAPSYSDARRAPTAAGRPAFYSAVIASTPQRIPLEPNMTITTPTKTRETAPSENHEPLRLDDKAIDAARKSLGRGAVTPHNEPWRADIVRLLNSALATELVCTLRYRRHHFTARGLASPKIAEEFLVHANEELAHADRLAARIVQLGGEPDFSPDSLTKRSHAEYDESTDLKSMIRSNLVAERVAIETYSQMVELVGDKDATTCRLLEDILSQEQEHAEELVDWLGD